MPLCFQNGCHFRVMQDEFLCSRIQLAVCQSALAPKKAITSTYTVLLALTLCFSSDSSMLTIYPTKSASCLLLSICLVLARTSGLALLVVTDMIQSYSISSIMSAMMPVSFRIVSHLWLRQPTFARLSSYLTIIQIRTNTFQYICTNNEGIQFWSIFADGWKNWREIYRIMRTLIVV
jgi:hypothetical protein